MRREEADIGADVVRDRLPLLPQPGGAKRQFQLEGVAIIEWIFRRIADVADEVIAEPALGDEAALAEQGEKAKADEAQSGADERNIVRRINADLRRRPANGANAGGDDPLAQAGAPRTRRRCNLLRTRRQTPGTMRDIVIWRFQDEGTE